MKALHWASMGLPLCSAVVLELPIIHSNSYSLVEIQTETPPRTFRLLFDTGSASSWLVDKHCALNCTNVSGYKRVGYDVDRTESGELTGAYGAIDYFGGNTAGPVAEDIFSVDSFSWKQKFLAANESNWSSLPADGFLGLAFNTIIVGNATTVMHTLIDQLDYPRFSVFYGTAGESSDSGADEVSGHLVFGGSRIDDYVTGEKVTIPITPREEGDPYEVWRSHVHSISTTTTNGSVTTVPFGPARVVFDTGGGQIMVAEDKIESVYESIGLNYTALMHGDRILDCSEFNSSWSMAFSFVGESEDDLRTVTVTGDQLATPGFPAAPDACWPPFEPGAINLFGKRFLKNFYSVWDLGAAEVKDYDPTLTLGPVHL